MCYSVLIGTVRQWILSFWPCVPPRNERGTRAIDLPLAVLSSHPLSHEFRIQFGAYIGCPAKSIGG